MERSASPAFPSDDIFNVKHGRVLVNFTGPPPLLPPSPTRVGGYYSNGGGEQSVCEDSGDPDPLPYYTAAEISRAEHLHETRRRRELEEFRRRDAELARLQTQYGVQEGLQKLREKYTLDQPG